RQRAARIETIPTKPKNQAADCGNRQIVREHRSTAIAFELSSQPRSEHNGPCKSDGPADRVHDGRTSKVVEAGSQVRQKAPSPAPIGRSHRCQETIGSPGPVADDRINEARDTEAVN